jgi:imidazolonepropionase-like amidohydrolase
MYRIIATILVVLFIPSALAAQRTLIVHAGTLLAVPGEAPLTRQSIVIEDDRIIQVVPGFIDGSEMAGDTQILDLSDQFVLPGLMDMHVHLLIELDATAKLRELTETPVFKAMRGVANASKTLRAGFTTVRDLGGDPESIFALRDAINTGLSEGPTVFAAGSAIAATGGHGDIDGIRADLMKLWTPDSICDGAVDCRRATRQAIKYGADWIKITATGGVLSDSSTGLGVQMTPDELAEIVTTAHNLGRKVAAHAHGTSGVNAALVAGVDSIDHGTFLDKRSIKLFRETDAWLVPTLMPGHMVPKAMAGNPFFTDAIKEKAQRAAHRSKASFQMAQKGGVRIAFGTDTGVTPHGMNAMEFELMVAAGMSPAQAIRSATVNTAELLNVSDSLGTLEVGKLADLVAVRGNPLEDISLLQNISTVVKAGQLIR